MVLFPLLFFEIVENRETAKYAVDLLDGGKEGETKIDQLTDHFEHDAMIRDVMTKGHVQYLECFDEVVDPLDENAYCRESSVEQLLVLGELRGLEWSQNAVRQISRDISFVCDTLFAFTEFVQ